MTQFLGTVSSYGGSFPANRNDDRSQPSEYSDKWQRLGQDLLWPRSAFIGASGGGGQYSFELSNGYDIWDWAYLTGSEGKIGQKRDGLSGITRDNNGNPLASCTVVAFDLATNQVVDVVTSSAATATTPGSFFVSTPFTGLQMYLWAYLSGTPVEGASPPLTPS